MCVLFTTELLERILVHLLNSVDGNRTLFVSAQRVSRDWYRTIQDSYSLFFKAPANRNAPQDELPLLKLLLKPFYRLPNSHRFPVIEGLDGLPLEHTKSCFTCPEASWRKVLYHQPPYRVVGLALRVLKDEDLTGWAWKIDGWVLRFHTGITMGDLYDLAMRVFESNGERWIQVMDLDGFESECSRFLHTEQREVIQQFWDEGVDLLLSVKCFGATPVLAVMETLL